MLLVVACTGPTALPDSAEAPDSGEALIVLGSASIAANPDNIFSAVVSVTVDHDASVVVEYGEAAFDHQTPAVDVVANTPTDVLVLGLRADREFTFQATGTVGDSHWTSDPLSYRTAPLSPGFPNCTATFGAPESEFDVDEVTCTNSLLDDGEHVYWCADRWGEPVSMTRTSADDALMSMAPLPDGSWVATSNTTSKLLFFDRAGKEQAAYLGSWFRGKTRYDHDWIDNHEALPIVDGVFAGDVAFITSAYEFFDDGTYKLGSGFIVFDPISGEADYDYSFHGLLGDEIPMDPKMPYTRTGFGDNLDDWTHLNAIVHGTEADGREYFLLSLKAQDWIFKLYPDTDELVWALGFEGDLRLVDDVDAPDPEDAEPTEWMYHQHGIRLLESSGSRSRLLMFDNGYPRHDEHGPIWDVEYSRVVELEYDEASKMAAITWEYGSEDSSSSNWMESSICGSAELLPGGDRVLTNEGERGIRREISYPEGAERWRLTCDNIDICEYRVRYYPSVYENTWMYE